MSRRTTDGHGGKLAGASLFAALTSVTQPVWVLDRDGLIRVANPAAAATLGYPDAEELLGRNGHDTVHLGRVDGESHPASECPLLRPRTTGETVTRELDGFVRRDGSTLAVSYVSAPIELPDGRGAVLAFTDIEARCHAEQALTERETKLTEQEDALRRVATLIARETAPDPVFHAVAHEAAALLKCDTAAVVRFEKDATVSVVGAHHTRRTPRTRFEPDPDYIIDAVRRTGRAARFDTENPMAADMPEPVRAEGIRSGLAMPILVGGDLWGAMTVASLHGALPPGTDRLLADFTDLLSTAVSHAQAHDDLQRLAGEQAALRRVATLVAREAPQADVFAAIAQEIRRLLGPDVIRMVRYEDDFAVVVGSSTVHKDRLPVGSRHPLDGDNVTGRVFRTGRPARIDDYSRATGKFADTVRLSGMRAAVGTPIAVEGRLWGAIVAATSRAEPLPHDTEMRLGQFTELMATAIANTESHARADRLAEAQASLRRVATLVATESSLRDVFAMVADEVARVLGDVECALLRDEGDGTASIVAISEPSAAQIGERLSLDDVSVTSLVLRDGRLARLDDYAKAEGEVAGGARDRGIRSSVGAPILVGDRVWGVMAVATREARPLAADAEAQLAQFGELVATAIANTEARGEVERLADEQAALRRVATLVAAGVQPSDLFSAVSQEVAQLFGTELASVGWFDPDGPANVIVGLAGDTEEVAIGTRIGLEDGLAVTAVYRTGHAARIDRADWSGVAAPVAAMARRLGAVSTVASPIVVEGHLWGCVTVMDRGTLPLDTEDRLANFTELVGTAIANAESRARVRRLADEQAALRRVATLVAEAAPPSAVFGAVASEAGALFGADFSGMLRIEDATTVRTVATWAAAGDHPEIPGRWTIEPGDPMTLLADAAAAVRVEAWGSMPGEIARVLDEVLGVACSVGCPITVEGRPWGALAIHCKQGRPLPPDTESRITQFTDLVGTAIANAESHARADRLADEQAALRRVATLVAQDARLEAVFAKVAGEVARTLGDVDSALWRDDGDGTVIAVAVRGAGAAPAVDVGTRLTLDGDSVIAQVLHDGRSHRIDDFSQLAGSVAERARELGMGSAVGCPIVVGARTWGAMTVASYGAEPLAPETETRVARFSDLVATAIGNAETRGEVARLADEQAALRRVATLVAQGMPSEALFNAVCAEVEALAGADACAVVRFEPSATVTVMGTHAGGDPVGARLELDPGYIVAEVHRTARAARFDTDDSAAAGMPGIVRAQRIRSGVAIPIVVEGELWGAITTASRDRPLPAGTERRLADFTELVATAVANADSREQLTASRARLLTAADDARRRVVRDLHDGAQQRLVHAIISLKIAEEALEAGDGEAVRLVGEALTHAELGNEELRELAHGILPVSLTNGGLRAGLDAVVARLDVAVRLDVPPERFAAEIEASAYFLVAEALTNVVKHAHAEHAEVRAFVEDGMLHVHVRDDGAGGADPGGNGLVGMADRVTALGGRLAVGDAPGGGTLVAASLPLSTA
jgi:PAS domain S-box-containing protein